MAIKKCAYCGQLYNSFGADICAKCVEILDEAYDTVKKYIYQHPGETEFAALVQNTDVSEKAINYLIETGRLEVRKPGIGGSRCRICGTETYEGSLCVNCMHKMLTQKQPEESEAKKEIQQNGKSGTQPLMSRQR